MKKTFMESEIEETAAVLNNLIDRYIINYAVAIDFPSDFSRIQFIASGSSYNCARLGEKFFEDIADVNCSTQYSSEFLSKKKPKIDPETLYVFVSQSGETYDTLLAMKKVLKEGAKAVVITNSKDCTMNSMTHYSVYAFAGVEKSIAATKSFSACVLCLYLCALRVAQNKAKNISKYFEDINSIFSDIQKVLDERKDVINAAKFLAKFKAFPIIGYDYYYILAKEGSLKIKETSYINTNAYALGEFMHGHIALLNKNNTVLAICSKDMSRFEYKTLRKIKIDYNPKIVCITDYDKPLNVKSQIVVKAKSEISHIFCILITLQLLALEIAKRLRRNIDNPKGLCKVVRG